jgi:hypothetical protein
MVQASIRSLPLFLSTDHRSLRICIAGSIHQLLLTFLFSNNYSFKTAWRASYASESLKLLRLAVRACLLLPGEDSAAVCYLVGCATLLLNHCRGQLYQSPTRARRRRPSFLQALHELWHTVVAAADGAHCVMSAGICTYSSSSTSTATFFGWLPVVFHVPA